MRKELTREWRKLCKLMKSFIICIRHRIIADTIKEGEVNGTFSAHTGR